MKIGPFRIGESGRPEGTSETDQGILHYTCNAPSDEVLEASGVKAIGKIFGVGGREVVLIPKEEFEKRGIKPGTIEAENLLRDMGRGRRR